MKGSLVLLSISLITFLGLGVSQMVGAGINASPAVAINGNDEVTITWGYLGLGDIPTILARRYDPEGKPSDNVEFEVSSPFGAPSIFNYDPDIATDSSNNAVIAWCSYEFSYPGENIKVVYTKVPPKGSVTTEVKRAMVVVNLSPQEGEEINLLNIPYSPVIAVDGSDNVALAWCYYDFESGENGIYLTVVDSKGTAITPVKVADNMAEDTCTTTPTTGQTVKKTGIAPTESSVKPIFYHSPSVAIDGEGNIVLSWTATGMLPCIIEGTELPLTAVFYSKYDTSGSVVSGYDKETVGIGFNSKIAVDESGNMMIAWNVLDILALKVRIMAAIYSTGGDTEKPAFEVGVLGYAPTSYVDNGNDYINRGIGAAADSEGNFLITWGGGDLFNNHVYLKEIYSNDYYLSNEIQVSQGFNSNYDPSIAIDSKGNLVITWNKYEIESLLGGTYSIYARRYDTNLQALGDEFKVNLSY